MLLRRYGSRYQSVELNFDAHALNEISFRRDHQTAWETEDFESSFERREIHALEAEAEGDVHDEVETAALDDLKAQVEAVLAGLGEGEVAVVESEPGGDYPKTRQATRNVIVEGENRLHFTVRISPPLQIGVYRPTS